MKNKSSTKKSLLFSVLSLFLSLVLLAGTTFAWFTDTASTSVNTIHSGTLDITLEDSEENSLEGQSLSFLRTAADGIIHPANDILWEPGATFETDSFHVVNQGNLAVKYKILLNQPEGSGKLAEVIDWSIQIGDVKHSAVPGSNLIVDGSDYLGHLGPNEKSEEIMIVAHMYENAGNDYQNLTLSGISFQVLATQDTVEYDSFSNTYDAQAVFDTSAAPVVDPDWSITIDPDPSLTDPNDPDFSDNPQYRWNPDTHAYELIDPGTSDEGDLTNPISRDDYDPINFKLRIGTDFLALPDGFSTDSDGAIIGPDGSYYKPVWDPDTSSYTWTETDEPWIPDGMAPGAIDFRTGSWIVP